MEEAGISPNHLNLVGNFDAQVEHIMESVRLTKQDVDQLNILYKQLEKTLQRKWPDCKVIPFGSIVTGLGIKTSDVDCYIETVEGSCDVDDPANVMEARNLLRRQHWIFQKAFAIPSAKVPIVKFLHVPTGIHCDINFKSASGVRNSRLLELLLNFDQRALTLAVLIKYWGKVHKLTGTNLMSNYSLTLLVIFYLQQINILPPIMALQDDHLMYNVDNWNTAINDNVLFHYTTDNSSSIYELLGGFFKFYSSLRFQDNILSLYLGKLLPRTAFKSLESVASEFDMYLNNVSSDICKPIKLDTQLCVQDPFEHNKNTTMAIYPKLASNIIEHFHLAAKIYAENKSTQFLTDILYRKIKRNHMPIVHNRVQNGVIHGKVHKPRKNIKKGIKEQSNVTDLFLKYRKTSQ